jgi:hypothetical protein
VHSSNCRQLQLKQWLLSVSADAEHEHNARGHPSEATSGMSLLLCMQVDPLGRAEAESKAAIDGAMRDEQRLAELGRRSVEMYVLSHIFLEKIAVGESNKPNNSPDLAA